MLQKSVEHHERTPPTSKPSAGLPDAPRRSPEESAALLTNCMREGDSEAMLFVRTLGLLADVHGINDIARACGGLSADALRRELSGQRAPSLQTVVKVLRAMDLRFRVRPS